MKRLLPIALIAAFFSFFLFPFSLASGATLSDGTWAQSAAPGTTTLTYTTNTAITAGDKLVLTFPAEAVVNAAGTNISMTSQIAPLRTNNATTNTIIVVTDTAVPSATAVTLTMTDALTSYDDTQFIHQSLAINHTSAADLGIDVGLLIIDNTTTVVSATVPSTDTDGDGVPDHLELGDRDGDGIPDNKDFDPTGWFFDEKTGEIIPGGLVTITGPGTVFVLHDGSTGFYQWGAYLDPGIYTMSITYPPGYEQSRTCRDLPTPFAAAGGPASGVVLGHDQNGNTGFMINTECTPYYYSFDANFGDPLILLNNIPLVKDADLSETGQSVINFIAIGLLVVATTSTTYILTRRRPQGITQK